MIGFTLRYDSGGLDAHYMEKNLPMGSQILRQVLFLVIATKMAMTFGLLFYGETVHNFLLFFAISDILNE